jgi:hypothetical protein
MDMEGFGSFCVAESRGMSQVARWGIWPDGSRGNTHPSILLHMSQAGHYHT